MAVRIGSLALLGAHHRFSSVADATSVEDLVTVDRVFHKLKTYTFSGHSVHSDCVGLDDGEGACGRRVQDGVMVRKTLAAKVAKPCKACWRGSGGDK